ncbi:MAG: hypothetical protein LBF41_03625, partial [Deltaproteobacteria bacterium]|nr:hypothetical protein [Deltaproteobacteria bacterium]
FSLTHGRFSGYSYRLDREQRTVLRDLGAKEREAILENAPDDPGGRVTRSLNLKDLFGSDLRGKVLVVGMTSGRNEEASFLQVTDIGLAVKVGKERSVVWTTGISSGKNLPDVEISFLNDRGEVFHKTKTGADGTAFVPGADELAGLYDRGRGTQRKSYWTPKDNFYVAARKGEDLAFWNLDWQEGFNRWFLGLRYEDFEEPLEEEPSRDWLLTSQPIYKKGETVRFKIIARSLGDDLTDLDIPRARVVAIDPANNVVYDETLEVSDLGTLHGEFEIGEDRPYGIYPIWLDKDPGKNRSPRDFMVYGAKDATRVGEARVLFYRAPAFELAFDETAPKEFFVGDGIEIGVNAKYHYGSPVTGEKVDFTLRSSPANDFKVPGLSAFFFVNRMARADTEGGSEMELLREQDEAESEVVLDDEGRALFKAEVTPAPIPHPRTFTLRATASDVDSRTVSESTSFTAHPASLYAGLRTLRTVIGQNETANFELVATDPKGAMIGGVETKLTLRRRFWTSVRRRGMGGVFETVSRFTDEPLGEMTRKTESVPVPFEFKVEKPGLHWVEAEIKDDRGRTNSASVVFYVAGPGEAGWISRRDDLINLVPDKTEYAPGDVAKILVQSPFMEGTGLATVERAGVREARTFELNGQSKILSIPILEDDSPNVYVSVILARGRISEKIEGGVDLGKPAVRKGLVKLKVPSGKDVLDVSVTPAATEFKPGDEVTVDFKIKDHRGNDFSGAEIAVAVVDAALIQIGGDDAFHPEKLFAADMPLMVETAANLESVMGRINWLEKGGLSVPAPGGGGYLAGDGEDLRKDFRPLAFFKPDLIPDAEGSASATFKLPDNLTTFRIFAVATGKGKTTGTGTADILVTKDLLLRSSLPNHAGVGDVFRAAAILTNRSDSGGEADVTFASEGLETLGETDKKVTLAPGENRELFFPVKALKAEKATVTIKAVMNDNSDTVEFTFPIVEPDDPATVADFGSFEAGGTPPPAPADPRAASSGKGSIALPFVLPGGLDKTRG